MKAAGGMASILVPNATALGYALFLAVNAAGVWGGVFPFLPMSFQTHRIVLSFFTAQALVFSLTYFASAVGSYFLPALTRSFLVKLASVVYACGWAALIAAIYVDEWALGLVVAGGALLGLGSAGFYMLWQRLFASLEPDAGNRDLVLGTACGALLYFALYLIPQAVTAFLIPLVFLPLFGLCITLQGRRINLDQPMFQDVPRNHPKVYRRILHDYWRGAVAVGVIGFCAGVMRALAVADPQLGVLVNAMSMGGMLIAAIAVLMVWFFRNVHLNVIGIYRTAFPFLITSFLLLPFAGTEYSRWLAAILYAVYSAAIMLMMIQCAQISRDRGVNPVFVYGFFGAVVYAMHDVGFASGTFAEGVVVMGLTPLAVVALVAVYLLGLMHFVSSGGFVRALEEEVLQAGEIELVALRSASPGQVPGFGAAPLLGQSQERGLQLGATMALSAEEAAAGGSAADLIAARSQLLRSHYRLSAREAEIMELIARGNTVARIAEMLFVSENTVRTHSKRIYTKLGIHKKQELVDLVHRFES